MLLPSRSALAALLFSSFAEAQYLINELSFGHSGKISPENNGIVPGFHIQGQPYLPEVLSNRLILTPVQPGNQRGAIWADNPLQHSAWIADVDFRASGPDRGGGNLNIWLANRGPSDIAASSIYTVGRFEGLAIVIDTHGGTGGMIRGFLNDGSTDYSKSHNIDQLAFGHCFYSYRNLGRPSQIKFRQEEENFKVEIDGRLCFESGKIQIPAGYKFGLTAATPDNPDSWEIFKLVVMADSLDPSDGTASTSSDQHEAQKVMQAEDKPKSEKKKTKKTEETQASTESEGSLFEGSESSGQEQPVFDDPYDSSIADHEAEYYTSSKAQFADLHDRLQSVNHHVSTIYRTVAKHSLIGERRHEEVSKMLHQIQQDLSTLREIKTKIDGLERDVKDMRKDMNSKLKTSESSLKTFLSDHHAAISDNIVKAAPGHGRLILVIVGSQLILVAAYALYKRRKGASPKKYL